MKRIVAIALCIIMVVLFSACGEKTSDNYENESNIGGNSPNYENESNIGGNSPNYISVGDWQTVIFGETEDSTIFHADEMSTDRFSVRDQKKEDVKKEITVDLWGTEHTGIYTETVTLPRSDTRIHVYELENSEFGSIMVDAKSNQIVEYSLVPYDASKLKSEKDFTDMIDAMVGDSVDLSEYDYECTTHYYSFSEYGMDSSVVDGFRLCDEKNEKLGSYTFYYTKSIDGIKLPDHVSVEFNINSKSLSLEIYEYDYDEEIYDPLLENMDSIKKSVENHLRDSVKDNCKVVNIKQGIPSLFVQDGKAYVMIRSTVEYESDYYKDQTFEIGVQTITGKK